MLFGMWLVGWLSRTALEHIGMYPHDKGRRFLSLSQFDGYFPVTVEITQSGKYFRTSEGINALAHSWNRIRTLNSDLV